VYGSGMTSTTKTWHTPRPFATFSTLELVKQRELMTKRLTEIGESTLDPDVTRVTQRSLDQINEELTMRGYDKEPGEFVYGQVHSIEHLDKGVRRVVVRNEDQSVSLTIPARASAQPRPLEHYTDDDLQESLRIANDLRFDPNPSTRRQAEARFALLANEVAMRAYLQHRARVDVVARLAQNYYRDTAATKDDAVLQAGAALREMGVASSVVDPIVSVLTTSQHTS